MNPHQKWFALRFAAGIVLCAFGALGYTIFSSRHAASVAHTSMTTAARLLSECAQSPEDGRSLFDALSGCAMAAHAADDAAHAMHRSVEISTQLASSRIRFARIFAPQTPISSDGLAERLAVFADDLAGLAEWWPTTSVRVSALAEYDAATDLRDVAATQDKEDFIRRLYLAKGALLLIRESLSMPQANSYGASIEGLPEMLGLINRLIIATDTGNIESADVLRQQYISDMEQLSRRAASMRAQMEQRLSKRPWSSTAHKFVEELR